MWHKNRYRLGKAGAARQPQGVRRLRRTGLSTGILLVVLLAAGAAYSYLSHSNTANTSQAAPVSKPTPKITPVAQDPRAPESAAIESLNTPVKIGGQAMAAVKTSPLSTCTIAISYSGITSTGSALGLGPKTADDFGSLYWKWTIGSNIPAGPMTVNITCSLHGKSAVVQGVVQVTK